MKIVVTGSHGLVGWHLLCYFHNRDGVEILPLDRSAFNQDSELHCVLAQADVVVHLAGQNRGDEEEVAATNISLAQRLVDALRSVNNAPHVLFSSSTQALKDNVYGNSKRQASEILSGWAKETGAVFTNMILPHIYGEFGRPHYNSAISTFCHEVSHQGQPKIKVDAELELLHAQDLAQAFHDLIVKRDSGTVRLSGEEIRVSAALKKLQSLYTLYSTGIIPNLDEHLDLRLFNTLRSYMYPSHFPMKLIKHVDQRGGLFEAVKGYSGGQTFISTTHPGITRGEHYHLAKVERFLVLQGQARIEIRRLYHTSVESFIVNGDEPCFIDMPTMHTHNITNVGDTDLVTLFWSNEIFDPNRPDTYAEKVRM